ncbi:MAG: class I SAM-dependent methyltransferase [Saprospiraceae bacterium]|nr:class I SAM-dependent methyltransferase [Saprospiraceae bacterium]
MNKGKITIYLRRMGLMMFADKFKFYLFKFLNYRKNKNFISTHPEIKLPPDYIMFESFKLDYEKYYIGGRSTAQWLVNLFKKYSEVENKSILDWGCGPARITRHLPEILHNSKSYGCDYNEVTIKWCSENISNVTFLHNDIDKPLNYKDNQFDFIIGISIFTHLSEENHFFCVNELNRIMKNNGIAIITTAGNIFKQQMTTKEVEVFENNQLVIRANVIEGHRTFAAFQPKVYFENLICDYFEIFEYKPGIQQTWGLEQDYWVLKVKK